MGQAKGRRYRLSSIVLRCLPRRKTLLERAKNI